jgi:hypothetical protein
MKLFQVNLIPGMGWLDAIPVLKPEQVRLWSCVIFR